MVFLDDSHLQHSTIKGYLSALRRLQIVFGMGDPFVASWPLLEYVMKGIKTRQARSAPMCAKPITPPLLLAMRSFWERDKHNVDNIMLRAACCTCFFGFLRSGEITVRSQSLRCRAMTKTVI